MRNQPENPWVFTRESGFAYLIEPNDEYPVGTLIKKCDPSTAHQQARAMLGHDNIPMMHFTVVGTDNVLALRPHQWDWEHPNAPSRVGPFVLNAVRIDADRLHRKTEWNWSIETKWPNATLVIILNTDRQNENGQILGLEAWFRNCLNNPAMRWKLLDAIDYLQKKQPEMGDVVVPETLIGDLPSFVEKAYEAYLATFKAKPLGD